MWVWPRLARRRPGHWATACVLNVGVHSNLVGHGATGMLPQRTGCTFRYRRWWTPWCLPPSKSSSRRTAAVLDRAYVERATSCKAWCAVRSAATLSTVRRSARPSAGSVHAATRITVALAPTRIDSGVSACATTQIRTDLLDAAVWREACALLEQPNRLEQEYRQRLAPADEHAADHTTLELQRTKLCHGLTRLIDSYTEGFLEKQEFESRITRQRQRIAALDEQIRQFADAASTQRELRLLIGRLEEFAAQVENGLDTADWPTRREIIRTLVSRVEIDHTQVNVMFRVPPDPFVASPDRLDRGVLQHCRRGETRPLRAPMLRLCPRPVLKHARRQPLADQAYDALVAYPVFHERYCPFMHHRIEKAS